MPELKDTDRKCALYVRVSTANQADEGESLDEQVEKLKNYCAYKGWESIVIYREEGFSGKDTKRPEFQRLMADVHKGKINTVIVKKVDRLSRSIIDFENIYKIFDEKDVDLISLQENFDTSTAIGRAVIRIVLVFAQMEREQTSERTIDVMAYRAKQGMFNGGYPRLGYDIDYENKCLVVNESEALIAKEIFDQYLQKGSLSETAIALNAKGYRLKAWTARTGRTMGGEKFAKNSLNRILRDPVYVGKVRYKDEVYPGMHPGIIEEHIFDSVQVMLDSNNMTRTGYRQDDNSFLLKGLTYCAVCHSAMTPSFSLSKGKKYHYYRCTCSLDPSKNKCRVGSVAARKIEGLVVEELKFLAEDPRIIEGVVESAAVEQKNKVREFYSKRKVLQDRLVQIDKKAKNLLDVISESGKDGQPGYVLKEIAGLDEQAKQLRKEIDFLDFEIKALEGKIVNADLIRENFKVFKNIYEQLTQDEKYDLLHLLIKRITYFEDAEKAEDGSMKGKIKMDLWELPPIDPFKINSAKTVNNGFAESHAWLPGRDSNPRPGG
jgi:site-specific DNA recombinase